VVLQARVESLLEGTERETSYSPTTLGPLTRVIVAIVVVAAGVVAFHAYAPVLESVHTATEIAVHHLP